MESITINLFPESTDDFSRYRFLCMGDAEGQWMEQCFLPKERQGWYTTDIANQILCSN